ncbi:hypothetical protein TNCV_941401 [Trichonephila clavipes]|nr:hypothetical protein TNCV_941401 [Trichonephila clavipes]
MQHYINDTVRLTAVCSSLIMDTTKQLFNYRIGVALVSTNGQYGRLHRLKIETGQKKKYYQRIGHSSQKSYCALPDKVNLKDSLDTLTDLQQDSEEANVSFLVLLSNYESKKETVNNTSKNNPWIFSLAWEKRQLSYHLDVV